MTPSAGPALFPRPIAVAIPPLPTSVRPPGSGSTPVPSSAAPIRFHFRNKGQQDASPDPCPIGQAHSANGSRPKRRSRISVFLSPYLGFEHIARHQIISRPVEGRARPVSCDKLEPARPRLRGPSRRKSSASTPGVRLSASIRRQAGRAAPFIAWSPEGVRAFPSRIGHALAPGHGLRGTRQRLPRKLTPSDFFRQFPRLGLGISARSINPSIEIRPPLILAPAPALERQPDPVIVSGVPAVKL